MAFAGPAVYAAMLATAEEQRLATLLDEIDGVIRPSSMQIALVTLVQCAVHAALKLGDGARAVRYTELMQTAMREEPHVLGAALTDFGRTLARWQRDPASPSARRDVERLRERLDGGGLRWMLALTDDVLARARPTRPRRAR